MEVRQKVKVSMALAEARDQLSPLSNQLASLALVGSIDDWSSCLQHFLSISPQMLHNVDDGAQRDARAEHAT